MLILLPGPSHGFPLPSTPTCDPCLCFSVSHLPQQFLPTSAHRVILNGNYTSQSCDCTPQAIVSAFECLFTGMHFTCSARLSRSLLYFWDLGGQSERMKTFEASLGNRHSYHPISSHTSCLESQTTPGLLLVTADLPTLCVLWKMELCNCVFCDWLRLSVFLVLACGNLFIAHSFLLLNSTPLDVSTFHSSKQFVDAGLIPYFGFSESHCFEHSYASL